jgi:hypothetical protein
MLFDETIDFIYKVISHPNAKNFLSLRLVKLFANYVANARAWSISEEVMAYYHNRTAALKVSGATIDPMSNMASNCSRIDHFLEGFAKAPFGLQGDELEANALDQVRMKRSDSRYVDMWTRLTTAEFFVRAPLWVDFDCRTIFVIDSQPFLRRCSLQEYCINYRVPDLKKANVQGPSKHASIQQPMPPTPTMEVPLPGKQSPMSIPGQRQSVASEAKSEKPAPLSIEDTILLETKSFRDLVVGPVLGVNEKLVLKQFELAKTFLDAEVQKEIGMCCLVTS